MHLSHLNSTNARDFRSPEASQASDGYILATVSFPDVEGGGNDGMEEMLEELLKDLSEWQARKMKNRNRLLNGLA